MAVKLEQVAQLEPANFASPVAIGDDLYVIDQGGAIRRMTEDALVQVFGPSNAPDGITLGSSTAVLNIAGKDTTLYAVFRSTTLPSGVPVNQLPPGYDGGLYEVVYRYDRANDGSISDPKPITSFESTTTPGGHIGGGLLTLPDGMLVFARGDGTGFRADGLAAPQDNQQTVGKLVLIDPADGRIRVAASGLRNPQRITFIDSTKTTIAIGDIGASTAEEINLITVADLRDTSTVENFGWGRNRDGNAREGTFYINDGEASVPGTVATAIGLAQIPESGFVQPFAQFGREEAMGFFAVTGPVASETSFKNIGLLFGDLVAGRLFATLAGATGTLNDVFEVQAVDAQNDPLVLSDLNDGDRVDSRFFNFANGDAGLLLERTGVVYRVTEVVPHPSE